GRERDSRPRARRIRPHRRNPAPDHGRIAACRPLSAVPPAVRAASPASRAGARPANRLAAPGARGGGQGSVAAQPAPVHQLYSGLLRDRRLTPRKTRPRPLFALKCLLPRAIHFISRGIAFFAFFQVRRSMRGNGSTELGYSRLTQPLVRENGALRPASWDEALDRAAQGFRRNIAAHGPNTLGIFSCSKSTNEMNFLAQKLARVAFGTHNVDSCNRT